MIHNWVRFNESSESQSDRIDSITLEDIENIVKSAREMNTYLHNEISNYPLANKLYTSLQYICGFGDGNNMEDFLELEDANLVERISDVIKTGHSMRAEVTDVDFMNYWNDIIYICKFPKHPDTDEIKNIVTEEFIEECEYNTHIKQVHFNWEGADDSRVIIPNPVYILSIEVQYDEHIGMVKEKLKTELSEYIKTYGYKITDIIMYENQTDRGYGGVSIRISRIL